MGIGDLTMYRHENSHVAELSVAVLASARRRGVGSAIVGEAERLVRQAGRRELGGMDEVPVRAGYEDAAAVFAPRLGFVPAQHMVRRELQLPLGPERLRALVADPRSSPRGYSLITFTDRWPDAFMADRCELGRRMSTDIPLGEQERDEEVWDEARVRHMEASLAAQNRAKVTTAAVHDATGRVVAFTEIVIPLGAPESSWQHDTLVIAEHRGHGLGFAMKVTNAVAVDACLSGGADGQHVERGRKRAHDRRQRGHGLRGHGPCHVLAQEARLISRVEETQHRQNPPVIGLRHRQVELGEDIGDVLFHGSF